MTRKNSVVLFCRVFKLFLSVDVDGLLTQVLWMEYIGENVLITLGLWFLSLLPQGYPFHRENVSKNSCNYCIVTIFIVNGTKLSVWNAYKVNHNN